jgi:hypothetical protein
VDAVQIAEHVIVGASILHNFLPPWDFLNDYPQAQKAYKLSVYVIGYIALNARSSLYPALSTNNGTKKSDIVAAKNGDKDALAKKDSSGS